MHAISSYRGNRPTNTQTHKYTNRQDRLQYTAPLSSARSVTICVREAGTLCPRPVQMMTGGEITVGVEIGYVVTWTANQSGLVTFWPLTFWPWKWCPSHVTWSISVPNVVFLGLSFSTYARCTRQPLDVVR